MKRFLKLLLTVCTLLIVLHSGTVVAQTFDMKSREWSSKRTGTMIKSCVKSPTAGCDTIVSQVDFFTTPSKLNNNFSVKDLRSFVKFSINHADTLVFKPFTYMLVYQLKGYRSLNFGGTPETITDTAMVNYSPDSVNAYQDIHIKSYYGYYRVEVKILDVYDYTANYAAALAGSTTIPPPVAVLTSSSIAVVDSMAENWIAEAGMVLQTYDLKLATGSPSQVYLPTTANSTLNTTRALLPGTNTLRIDWALSTSETPVPAMYELEWTFVDDYAAKISDTILTVSPRPESALNYDFARNSSRVITNKTQFDIPLIYKRGYLLFRTRLLRPDSNDYQRILYGPWSIANAAGTVSSIGTNSKYRITSGHLSETANWNYESSFAEDGKNKQVLGYFDGLLKSRQTLTRFNSRQDELIGAESFYDFEGRAALQTLPVPVMQVPNFSYLPSFALSSATSQPYKAADIDALVPPNGTAQALAALHANSAAAKYYSPQNYLLATSPDSSIKAVPDAEGFPMMQTRFAPDDPKRVKQQGSAGNTLQLGRGHETSYYYSDPEQDELNKYFGVNVGNSPFYEKVITRDPNQELSFSVMNNAGKPVMTGLMGFPDSANATTLLNVDSIVIPNPNSVASHAVSNLLNGNRPIWTDNRRVFSKTVFREALGGCMNHGLRLPDFYPCSTDSLGLSIPLRISLSIQGEHDAGATDLIAPVSIPPHAGLASGPTVDRIPGAVGTSAVNLALAAAGIGESKLRYAVEYNPEDVDSAVSRYLQQVSRTANCIPDPNYLLYQAYLELPPDCNDESPEEPQFGPALSSPCMRFERLMQDQIRPGHIYGRFIRSGAKGDVIVGNGRSVFAIIGWTPKPGTTGLSPVLQQPSTADSGVFAPTCWPQAGSGTLAQQLDAAMQRFDPVYAYQQILGQFTITTPMNGVQASVTYQTPVADIISYFSDEIAARMMVLHPENCEYKKRYCDASDYPARLQAIPTAAAAQQIGRYNIADIILADPFAAVYESIHGNNRGDLGYMKYKLVNGSGQIVGEREVALDYFAYLMTTCDGGSSPELCWGTYLPNASGGRVTAPAGMLTGLTGASLDIYFHHLVNLYLANRGRMINAYRDPALFCGTRTTLKDPNFAIFEDYTDNNNVPNYADGPPSYASIVTGSLLANINTAVSDFRNPASPFNTQDEYAATIVRNLLNCRTSSNSGYDQTLFSNLYNDLKAAIAANIQAGADRIWKGGITPAVLKNMLTARNISLDDLCNPFLVNYELSERSMAEQCRPASDICSYVSSLQLNSSVLTQTIVDLYDYTALGGSLPIFYVDTFTLNYANGFDRALIASLGYPLPLPSRITGSWILGADSVYTLTFTYGAKTVTFRAPVRNPWTRFVEDANGHINAGYPSEDEAILDARYDMLRQFQTSFIFFGCADLALGNDTLRIRGASMARRAGTGGNMSAIPDTSGLLPPGGYVSPMGLEIIGLNIPQSAFIADTSDYSRSCMHTCIACNELKDAYRLYQQKVAASYGIKGKGHPFYERSLRSFMNYYFRNRHFTDEYRNFMKGCSLTDSLLLPQYYGYFTAHAPASGGKIGTLLNAMRSFAPVSPASAPFAGPAAAHAASAEQLKYLQYVDSLGEEYLYVDFSNLYTDERLRPYVQLVSNYLFTTPAVSGVSWYFNKLQSELPGQDPYTVDVFLPGSNTAINTALVPVGLSLKRQNVTVRDAASSTAAVQLSMPWTRYRFTASGTPTPLGIAGAYGELGSAVTAALNSGGLRSSHQLGSHESYRMTHGNAVAEKVAYLDYVYNLNAAHDATLSQLRAPVVQANVYTVAGQPTRDVAYRNGILEDRGSVSGTLQLKNPDSVKVDMMQWTFLQNIVNACKGTAASVQYPVSAYGQIPATVASGTPFALAVPGSKMNPGVPMPSGILLDIQPYNLHSVTRIQNNGYSIVLKPASTSSGPRYFHVQIRVPEYIDRKEALRYNLTSIAPLAYGTSNRYFTARFELPGDATKNFTAIGKTDFNLVTGQVKLYENVMLCDQQEEDADSISMCYEALLAQAEKNAAIQYEQKMTALYQSLRMQYRAFIRDSLKDTLTLSMPQMKYAVTLYQYDRAGNLYATTPPTGVQPMTSTAAVDAYRAGAATPVLPAPVPAHQKQTVYTYGAQNQKLSETTPDGGLTRFIYDVAGRLVLSQSARQQPDKYSYTLYDNQNRPTETGQITIPAASVNLLDTGIGGYVYAFSRQQYKALSRDHSVFRGFVVGLPREQVTRTTYDTAMYLFATTSTASIPNNGMSRQENLRGRVSAVASYALLPADYKGYTGFEIALHYSYDLSGNLKTLSYDMPKLEAHRQRFKRIDYDYDLYSGKVTLVSYNRGFADQFYQRYAYDDDNRITKAETSRDGIIWDRDAEYKYYLHGPLARISLGDQRVQGIDFAYTLQGWLKTINGDSPQGPADIGGDATGNNAHKQDLLRTTLAYFDGDYKPINATDATGATGSKLLKLPAPPAVNRSLYNGNIAAMTTLPGYFAPLHSAYRYDKLNRIKSADYIVPDYGSATPLAATPSAFGINGPVDSLFHSDYAYDLDGNLTALKRYGLRTTPGGPNWGLQSGQVYLMDKLKYYYVNGNRINNRLSNFTDEADHNTLSGGFSNDLAKYAPANADSLLRLQYDPSGNLVQDMSNGLTSINWNLYGKTREVVKDDGHTFRFSYDPLGNRFSKTTITASAGVDSILNTEYYIREASGNVLATYRQQQHYHYYNLYDRVTANNAGLNDVIAAAYGSNGGFGGVIVSGTQHSMSPAFVSARIATGSPASFVNQSAAARSVMMAATPAFVARVTRFQPQIADRLYPAGPQASWEPFSPLAEGITDSAELDRSAGLLFTGTDSLTMRRRYATERALDSATAYTPVALGRLLAEDIVEWRSQGTGVAEAHLKRMIGAADTNGALYTSSVRKLLRDSNYLKNPVAPAEEAVTLDRQLRQALDRVVVGGQDPVASSDSAVESQPSTLALVNNFIGQEYVDGAKKDSAVALLRRKVGDEVLLGAVYSANPAAFVTALLTDVGGTGGGTATARKIVSDALLTASGGSVATGAGAIGDVGSPLGMLSTLLRTDASKSPTLNNVLSLLLDYDHIYLAEHTMYGSSRLGIKKYWPTQYRYEWSKAKTLAQNLAALDTNELNHRMAWYYGPWQSLVTPTEVVAAAHANRKNLSSTRIVGQKGYELTNHLGNVMAVVSDKVTDKPAVANANLPAVVAKRAALSAAYDYYPFGMQMPGRVVEDATVQCIPVTRTRKVDKITSTEDFMKTYTTSDPGAPRWYNSGSNTQVDPPVAVTGGWRTDMKSLNSTTAIDAFMTFRALPAGASGLIVSVTMAENNYPAYNYPFSPYTLTGTLTVELRNLASGGIGTFLVTGSRTASGSVLLTVPPGMVAGGNVIRLWMHYDGPPVPRGNGPGNPPLTTPQSNISYTSVVSNVLQPVDQQYVALSCDTDGAYAATYRYGFNGQQKDDEIAGKGNHNTALFWEYDTRLGRRWNLDPVKNPLESAYVVLSNSPVVNNDLLGDVVNTTTDKAKKDVALYSKGEYQTKRGKDKQSDSKIFTEFANLINEWDQKADVTVNITTNVDEIKPYVKDGKVDFHGGTIASDGKGTYWVYYNPAYEEMLGVSGVLEESYHLKDAMEGVHLKFGADGSCCANLDVYDEARAKMWVGSYSLIAPTYKVYQNGEEYNVPTHYAYIKKLVSTDLVANALMNGVKLPAIPAASNVNEAPTLQDQGFGGNSKNAAKALPLTGATLFGTGGQYGDPSKFSPTPLPK